MQENIKKYRKKPVIIEAYKTDKKLVIHTLEGDMVASPGDYVITGVNGEKYPCKPDIFEKTYEPVEDWLLLEYMLFQLSNSFVKYCSQLSTRSAKASSSEILLNSADFV